jgi:PAS domain S-box-containing protein
MIIFNRVAKSLSAVPLRLSLIVPYVILITVIVSVTCYLSFRNGQQAVRDVVMQLCDQITRRVEVQLRDFLEMPHIINRENAGLVRLGTLDVEDTLALERHFWHQVQTFGSVSTIYFAHAEGGLSMVIVRDFETRDLGKAIRIVSTNGVGPGAQYVYSTDQQGRREALIETYPDYDVRTKPWYQNAVHAGEPSWNPIFISFTGEAMAISVSQPLYDEEGALLGVLGADLDLNVISDFLQELNVSPNGRVFIMQRSGALVATSSAEQPFRVGMPYEQTALVEVTQCEDAVIQATGVHLKEHFGGLNDLQRTQSLEFRLDGAMGLRHNVQMMPFRDDYGLDWLIVVVIPETDFMWRINASVRNTLLLVVLAGLVAAAVSVLIAEWIIRPIRDLNRSTKAMAAGEWASHSLVASAAWTLDRSDELGELARSFDHMARQLQIAFETLTSNVEARTTELHKSQAFLQTIYNHSEIAIFVVDVTEEGDYVYAGVNAMHERIFGMETSWIVGKRPQDLLERYDQNLVNLAVNLYDECVMSRQKVQFEHPALVGDEERWWISTMVPLVDQSGRVYRLIGTALEITERKRAEEDRTLLFNLSMDMLCIAGFDGYFKQVNPAWSATLGWLEEELLNKPWLDFVHPDDRAATVRIGRRLMMGVPAYDFQNRYRCKDGGYRWISWNSFPLPAERLILAVARDITQQRQAENALRRAKAAAEAASRAKSVFLTNMSHELRTPLNAMLGFTTLMLRDPNLTPAQRNNLATVVRSGEYLLSLINTMLDLSKAGSASIMLATETVDLYAVLWALESQFSLRAKKRGLTLHFELDASVPRYIRVDTDKLRRVLINLLDNAVKFTKQGRVILCVCLRK